ncbi:hypothetical protein ACFYWH_26270 [Streptomyces sp. NPDC003737]|uniref:hypothetical protein n=1 Tax=Streptomyces sp. NPDC003737 TaxID=3364685 RepID=UPI0036C95697
MGTVEPDPPGGLAVVGADEFVEVEALPGGSAKTPTTSRGGATVQALSEQIEERGREAEYVTDSEVEMMF